MSATFEVLILTGVLIGALALIGFYSWKAVSYVVSGTKDLVKGGKVK